MFYAVGKLKEVFDSDKIVTLTIETENGDLDMATSPKISALINEAEFDYMEPVIVSGEIINNGSGMILFVNKLIFIKDIASKKETLTDKEMDCEIDSITSEL